MRNGLMRNVLGLFIFAILALGPLGGMADELVNIEGEVIDNYRLVDGNGQVYEIADTTEGNELAEKYIGEKVMVAGTIEMDDDYRVVVVTSFQTLSE